MNTEELVQKLLDSKDFPPPQPIKGKVESLQEGMGAVMHYLECSKRPVTAGEISTALGVSTARVAVLLKKLDEKKYIIRDSDPHDARKTIVSLSVNGKAFSAGMRAELAAMLTDVIREVGVERFQTMLELQEEARVAAENYMSRHPRPEV